METVTRYRTNGGLDSNGDPVSVSTPPLVLTPVAIAPGATNELDAVGRDGERVEYTIYLRHGADVVDGDELEIRGSRYRARVRTWRPQWDPTFGGVEVLAVMGRG